MHIKQRFTINVWDGINGDVLIIPNLLPEHLDGNTYRIFLENVLSNLMAISRLHAKTSGFIMMPTSAMQFEETSIGLILIDRGGPVERWPQSPDLTPLHFYLWKHMKSMVNETPVTLDMYLIASIAEAAARVRDIPGQFERVRESMHRHCRTCIVENRRNFEHVL